MIGSNGLTITIPPSEDRDGLTQEGKRQIKDELGLVSCKITDANSFTRIGVQNDVFSTVYSQTTATKITICRILIFVDSNSHILGGVTITKKSETAAEVEYAKRSLSSEDAKNSSEYMQNLPKLMQLANPKKAKQPQPIPISKKTRDSLEHLLWLPKVKKVGENMLKCIAANPFVLHPHIQLNCLYAEVVDLNGPTKPMTINQAHQQVTNRAARQGQIEAQRFEGGVHSKTMDDDGESICRSRSKLVVTCLCAWLIICLLMLRCSDQTLSR